MAIIKTIEEVLVHADIGHEIDFEKLKPTLDYAAGEIIKPLIGSEQYGEIEAAYDADNLTQAQTDLLDKMHSAIVKIGLSFYTDIGELTFTNAGLVRKETGDQKTPFKYQTDNIREYYLQRGYEAAESLLEFLEDNTASYTTWAGSSAFTINKEFYINTARDFSNHYDIGNSRVTFQKMTAVMRFVDLKISKLISSELSTEIHDQILADNLSADNFYLLEKYLKDVFALLTIGEALQDQTIEYVHNGVLIYQFKNPSGKEAHTPDRNLLEIKKSTVQVRAEYYINEMLEYLNTTATASKYVAYYNSDLYEDPNAEVDEETKGNIYNGF